MKMKAGIDVRMDVVCPQKQAGERRPGLRANASHSLTDHPLHVDDEFNESEIRRWMGEEIFPFVLA